MNIKSILGLLSLVVAVWIAPVKAEESAFEAQFPGGAKSDNEKLADSECLKGRAPYYFNFTAYNPDVVWERDRGDFKKGSYQKLCQDIPALGKLYIAMDLNDELLDKEIGFRIVKTETKEPIFELPPKVYPKGIINAEYNFDTAGKYTAYLDVATGTEEGDRSIPVPLVIGSDGGLSVITELVIPLALIGIIGFWMYRRDQKKKAERIMG